MQSPHGRGFGALFLAAAASLVAVLVVRVAVQGALPPGLDAYFAGFWFVNINRSRSDGLSGFTGRIIRGKVRDGAREGMMSALTATKKKLEAR